MGNQRLKFWDQVLFLDDEATADVAYIASGNNLEEAFTFAGLALYHTIVDINEIDQKIDFKQEWEAEDLMGLLYDFLDDLIYHFDTKKLLLSEISSKIKKKSDGSFHLSIEGRGETFDENKHQAKIHIKAVTFFGMEITENSVKVTLDV